MKFTIHRGAKEIGGTCIEVTAGSTRILLDFGMPLSNGRGGEFDEKALAGKSVDDLISEKILYPIRGLYKNAEPQIDAILISHSHKDHYGFLKYAHPDIPVYMSSGAEKLIDVLNIFLRKEGQVQLPPILRTVRDRSPFNIGDLRITPYLVDHSAFDAMSFHVVEKTTGRSIFYTGDFRAAGWKWKLFNRFIADPPKGVDHLLMEGTTINRETGKYPAEEDVQKEVVDILRETDKKIVFACCSGQNIDRIVTFYKAARKTKSLLVIDPYTACALHAIKSPCNHIPQVGWDSIRVFIANYRGEGDIYVNKISNSKFKSFVPNLGRAKIKPADFSGLRQKALVLMRTTMIPAIKKIPCIRGSKLIYSQWEGYLKKDSVDAGKFKDFICEHEIDLEYVHTSGHATIDKLQKFAEALAPDTTTPIHTQFPEKYRECFRGNIRIVKDGETIEV